jgi:uncharacterized membrane protein (DUF106 family)
MLWLFLIVGVLTAAAAHPRVGKIVVRLLAVLVALVILLPVALIVTCQRMRLKRRRRNVAKVRAMNAADRSNERDESPSLGRAIPSP